jgi:hypothetical protein
MVAEFITVWVLVTSCTGYRPSVELGPYVDLESCRRVQISEPIKNQTSQCIQVNIPTNTIN